MSNMNIIIQLFKYTPKNVMLLLIGMLLTLIFNFVDEREF